MRNTNVAVKVCKEYNTSTISGALNDCFNILGGVSNLIKPHYTVLIKPDLYLSTEPNKAKTTNPNIVTALAELIEKMGAKCIIADSPKGDFKQSVLDNGYIRTQMLQSSNNGHATLSVNDKVSVIHNPNGEHCRDIYIIDALNDADVIINIGKLRCDKNLGLIGCSQNLFGLVPGKMKELIKSRCYTTKSYYNYIIDLYESLENKVILNILDGIVACESNNDPRILNAILVSENPFAVDKAALRIINQDPHASLLLNEAVRRNKFDFNSEMLGDDINSLICHDFHYSMPGRNIKPGSDSAFKRAYKHSQQRPSITSKLCMGCKVCVSACPMKAINMTNTELGAHAVIDYNKCISCFNCAHSCPYKIIKTKSPIKYKLICKSIKKSH